MFFTKWATKNKEDDVTSNNPHLTGGEKEDGGTPPCQGRLQQLRRLRFDLAAGLDQPEAGRRVAGSKRYRSGVGSVDAGIS